MLDTIYDEKYHYSLRLEGRRIVILRVLSPLMLDDIALDKRIRNFSLGTRLNCGIQTTLQ